MFVGIGAVINDAALFVFGLVLGVVLGLTSGITQWLVLRSYIARSVWWILSTCVAWGIFWSLNIAGVFGQGSGVIGKVWEGVGHGALFGLLLGLSQWFVLRNKVHTAEMWVWVNMIGWGIGAALGDGIKVALNVDGPIEIVIGFVIATILGGVYLARMINKTN